MQQQTIFEQLVQHYQETGEIMKTTQFVRLFQNEDPNDIVQAIYRFEQYLEEQRKIS